MSNLINQVGRDKVRRRLTFDQDEPTTNSTRASTTAPAITSTTQSANQNNEPNSSEIKNSPPDPHPPFVENEVNLEKMREWNFDFKNEVPLSGDWEWKRVAPPRTTDHKEVVKTLEMDKEERFSDRNV